MAWKREGEKGENMGKWVISSSKKCIEFVNRNFYNDEYFKWDIIHEALNVVNVEDNDLNST